MIEERDFGRILIIALTFHRLPRTVVYTQNGPLTAYLDPAALLFFFSQGRWESQKPWQRRAMHLLESKTALFVIFVVKSSVILPVLCGCLPQPSERRPGRGG